MIVLAVVQALTEFLPVSSSGHLTILGALAGIREENALFFFLVLHLGTLLATVVYFWRDLLKLAAGVLKGERASWRYIGMIALASVPTAIIGLGLRSWVGRAVTSPLIASICLLVTASFLWITRYLKPGDRGREAMTWMDALLVGLAQGVAIFPGISRSGATITTCMARGIQQGEAFRFSFLVSLPAIGGAFLLEAPEAVSEGRVQWMDGMVGLFLAFGVGLLALWILRKALVRRVFHHFAWWCCLTALLGFLVAGWLGSHPS